MPQTACDVLAYVLANEGSELSAHETLARAQRQSDDLTVLAAEYEAIARVAQQERWDALLDRCGLGRRLAAEVKRSDAYAPLVAALRRAEACGLDLESGLRDLVAQRAFIGVDDVAAVLHNRVEIWVATAGSDRRDRSDLIAGLVPPAVGVEDPDLARALIEREQLMKSRTQNLNAGTRRPSTPQACQGPDETVSADPMPTL
jgi:hypothetical protein